MSDPLACFPPLLDKDFVPLSPTSCSFLHRTLHSPGPSHHYAPSLPTPFSPEPFEPACFSARSWAAAAAQNEEAHLLDDCVAAGGWSNDLHEIVHSMHAISHHHVVPSATATTATTVFEVPALTAYLSDGESPDHSPVSSDVEDAVASPKSHFRQSSRRKLKRTFRELADPAYPDDVFAAEEKPRTAAITVVRQSSSRRLAQKPEESEDDGDFIAPLKECDANDEVVKAALLEDSPEAKAAAFPAIMNIAASKMRAENGGAEDPFALAVNSLLAAFTKDDKAGRALPRSCQELLRIATEEVALARKQRRENKTQRRFLAPNQPESNFVCHAPGCKKVYTTAEGLRLHIRNHHEVDKKWVCHAQDCTSERSFVRQADLRMHLIRMHSPVRPFPCRVPTCKKTFACHSELRRHISSEHNDLVQSLINAAAEFN